MLINKILSVLPHLRVFNGVLLAATLFLVSWKCFGAVSSQLQNYILGTLFVFFGGNLINAIEDVELDQHANSKKTKIDVQMAFTLYLACTVLPLLIAPDIKTVVLYVVCMVLLMSYSKFFQKRPFIGNLIVASLTFLSIIWLSVLNSSQNTILYWLGVCGFLLHLIRELIKDREDKAGDEKFGYKTVAVTWSLPNFRLLVWFLIAFCLLVMMFWQFFLWPNKLYSLGATAYLLIVAANKLNTAQHSSQFKFISGLLKLSMLSGLSTIFFIDG